VPMEGLALDDTIREALAKRFDERHHLRFGHEMPSARESVTFRVRAYGAMHKLQINEIATGSTDASSALRTSRDVFLASQRRSTGIYDRAKLVAGNQISGPAIIEEPAHVTVIFPGDDLVVDRFGNLVITIGG
jgi:N-methylhydantoinase A